MERIFNNAPAGILADASLDMQDSDTYAAVVRALIVDAKDFEESELAPNRETYMRYYEGLEPRLNSGSSVDIIGDPPLDDEVNNRSTVVSTDFKDTVLSILPSLIRMFASSDHVVTFSPNTEKSVEIAKQATDYVHYKFWEENNGFLTLYGVFKDALTLKMGIVKWWTDNSVEVSEQSFSALTQDQLAYIFSESADQSPQLVSHSGMVPLQDGTPALKDVTIRYNKSRPNLRVAAVPPDEFRVSRNATSIDSAALVGHEQILRVSDLVKMGYEYDEVITYAGATHEYNAERSMRNPGSDTYEVVNDLVRYGEYFIRIDQDGDNVNELRKICVMGDNYEIVADDMVDDVPYSTFSVDPVPHTLVGDSPAVDTMNIQDINTNLFRGSLNSLAQAITPRQIFNELLTNVDDMMNDDPGAVVRTRGDPATAVATVVTPFVGAQVFDMIDRMNMLRQQKTGISEASKGIDPKALQSTNVMGIDAIVSGAQERIELIGRILAETGMKRMYKGMLREITNNPNMAESIQISGKWVDVNPSLFDPSMRTTVNPTMGKGSDATRLMALQEIKETQTAIIQTFGVNNPICGVEEFRNTVADLAALANIKNVSRYFKEVTPEILDKIAQTPKEPDPATLLAQAELEKVKSTAVVKAEELKNDDKQMALDESFRRDKLRQDGLLELFSILKDAAEADADAEQYLEPGVNG